MKKKLKSDSPLDAATCSPSSCVEFIRRYNRWRRGDETLTMEDPKAIGNALDAVCDKVEELEEKYRMHHAEAELITSDNIRLKCTLAKWVEWARMHGHMDHVAGIADDTRRILSSENVRCATTPESQSPQPEGGSKP